MNNESLDVHSQMFILAFMPVSVALVLGSFVVMLTAYFLRQHRCWHVPLMGGVMIFDVFFPIYLYMTHDWVHRLIDQEELFSFAIWSHLFLILTLYSLYVLQVLSGKQMIAQRYESRQNHRVQSRGILVIRALVFLSGVLLIAPSTKL